MKLNIKLLIRVNAILFTGALIGEAILILGLTRGIWINSNLYQKITAEYELSNDVSPPPLFLVQASRLVARAMVDVAAAKDGASYQNSPKVQEMRQMLPILFKRYNERRQHWLDSPLVDNETKQIMENQLHEPASRWIGLVDTTLLPAINAGNREAALKNYQVLGANFDLHQRENERFVEIISKKIIANQELAKNNISRTIAMVTIATLLLLLLAYVLLYLMQRYSIRPLGVIANQLGAGAEQFVGASDQVASTSKQLALASDQVASSSQQLAEGASEQAAAIEETSASLEEMSSMIHSTASNADLAKSLAGEAQASAQMGLSSMDQMTTAMAAIEHSSNQVVKIVKSIDEIAFQTNILALNAAVEAARAGEAGAGFAVVAEEVRSLAQRSAAAANESATKIEAAILNSRQGSECLKGVSESFNLIEEKIKQTDNLVAEIALAAKEQAQGIEHITLALQEMSKVAQGSAISIEQMSKVAQASAANTEQIATAAEKMRTQAGRQRQIMVDLRNVVDGSRLLETTKNQPNPYLLSEAQEHEISLAKVKPQLQPQKIDDHFHDF